MGTLTAANYDFPAGNFVAGILTVTPEDARADYSGNTLFWTSSATSTTATVTLSATIRDITAVTGDPVYDADAGDIRNAKVSFVIRNGTSDTPISACTNLPIGLVNSSDTKVGTVTCNTSLSVSGTAGATQYMIGIVVNNYYNRNSSDDDTVINVAQPITSNFITGGGFLVNTDKSNGQYPGIVGMKTNFGFNIKYNKNSTNLQGNMNVIIRNGGRVYQIKGNSMTSLGVTLCTAGGCPSTTSPTTANFNGKASIQDITNPALPISIDGNATLQVNMTDNGEPGSSDSIGITVYNKSGGLWFSSYWSGTLTLQQPLGGGNLVAH